MSYYSNYGYESNDGGWEKIIAIIILLFFVAWGMDSCSVSMDRQSNHMVTITDIEGDYVYDENTKIVYIESVKSEYRRTAHTTYRPYISPSGNYYKYENGKLVELKEESK